MGRCPLIRCRWILWFWNGEKAVKKTVKIIFAIFSTMLYHLYHESWRCVPDKLSYSYDCGSIIKKKKTNKCFLLQRCRMLTFSPCHRSKKSSRPIRMSFQVGGLGENRPFVWAKRLSEISWGRTPYLPYPCVDLCVFFKHFIVVVCSRVFLISALNMHVCMT